MKKMLSGITTGALIVLCVPLFLLVLVGLVLYTPFDYIIYRASRFYRECGEKYTWLASIGDTMKNYNAAQKAGLPITYIGRGWFACGDTLLSNLALEYDDQWCVYEDGGDCSDVQGAVDRELEECRAFAPDRMICRSIISCNIEDEELPEPLPTGHNFRLIPFCNEEGNEQFLRRFIEESERFSHDNT